MLCLSGNQRGLSVAQGSVDSSPWKRLNFDSLYQLAPEHAKFPSQPVTSTFFFWSFCKLTLGSIKPFWFFCYRSNTLDSSILLTLWKLDGIKFPCNKDFLRFFFWIKRLKWLFPHSARISWDFRLNFSCWFKMWSILLKA